MEKKMTLGELAQNLQSGERIRISFEGWLDGEGEQEWSKPLTDAQIIAYQNHLIEGVYLSDRAYLVKLLMETANV